MCDLATTSVSVTHVNLTHFWTLAAAFCADRNTVFRVHHIKINIRSRLEDNKLRVPQYHDSLQMSGYLA